MVRPSPSANHTESLAGTLPSWSLRAGAQASLAAPNHQSAIEKGKKVPRARGGSWLQGVEARRKNLAPPLTSAVHIMLQSLCQVCFLLGNGNEHPNFQFRGPWGTRINEAIFTPTGVERGLLKLKHRALGFLVLEGYQYHVLLRKKVDAMGITGRFQIKVSVKDVTESLCIHFIRLNKYPRKG